MAHTIAHTKQFNALERSSPLFRLQQTAWDKFLSLGFPKEKGDPVFQYVPLHNLYSKDFNFFGKPSFECSYKDALDLESAMGIYGSLLKPRFIKSVGEERDPFALLNLALCPRGVFIYVPPETIVKEPIDIKGAERVHLFIGARAQVSCVCRAPQGLFSNSFFEISLDEGASLHQTFIDVVPEEACYLSHVRAQLKKDSQLRSVHVSYGSHVFRKDYKVVLSGTEASADVQGISCVRGTQGAHTRVWMEHSAPACRSMQNFKGLVSDRGQVSFEGKILVRSEAQKTQAYQMNRNFILSDGAQAYAKPNLEIFADDVKASHGATMAKWDEAQLFYLKTRGMQEDAAKKLVLKGFCTDILEQLKNPAARHQAESRIQDMI